MTRSVLTAVLTIVLAAGTLPAPARAQDSRPGVAVLPFENGGSYGRDREDLEALRRGIAGILISELATRPAIRLVDRAETQRLLDEQNLAASGRVDAATAARVGRLVGARYMIAGTFLDLYGDFRIDARIIDVETGEIVNVVRSDPSLKDRRQLYAMIQSVAERIATEARFPSAGAAAGTRPAREIPTEAVTFYSRALLYEDRGDRAKATEFYERALQLFPAFTEATEGLRKVRQP
ncbi:MAG TPA: CsgG/HfaB family protein [Gemmatimonadales bacterium]|nr:CsgG/HfaB family protein [Gemmatimonadales bacterium]